MIKFLLLCCGILLSILECFSQELGISERTRVIVTTDGEIDDECSLVRFLLYANEWDIEGIITSSSQYHWHGHKWAGDDWMNPVMNAYSQVYSNLKKHDNNYPSPEYLSERVFLGNVEAEGEMDKETPGSAHIVKVLLDESDHRPVWIQAWGGTNTLARSLKTIEEQYPDKMEYVASKLRFFFIWEQDDTYQKYIRPHWGKYNILTIISDQFIALFYHWKKYLPTLEQHYLAGDWMKKNIIESHGPLCTAYKAHDNGDFRSEGDSPAFMYTIATGLENLERPDWGGWGGRYVKVRENTWLDPIPEGVEYNYPEGRWYGLSAWGRVRLQQNLKNDSLLTAYLKPIWRWIEPFQNDFAARADWCVLSYKEANHPPVVKVDCSSESTSKAKVMQGTVLELTAKPGTKLELTAKASYDPDGDALSFRWWQYIEAGSYKSEIDIIHNTSPTAICLIPHDAKKGDTIHLICEVTDCGIPQLTRYKRIVLQIFQ